MIHSQLAIWVREEELPHYLQDTNAPRQPFNRDLLSGPTTSSLTASIHFYLVQLTMRLFSLAPVSRPIAAPGDLGPSPALQVGAWHEITPVRVTATDTDSGCWFSSPQWKKSILTLRTLIPNSRVSAWEAIKLTWAHYWTDHCCSTRVLLVKPQECLR